MLPAGKVPSNRQPIPRDPALARFDRWKPIHLLPSFYVHHYASHLGRDGSRRLSSSLTACRPTAEPHPWRDVEGEPTMLDNLSPLRDGSARRVSSWDTTGRNHDAWRVDAGEAKRLAASNRGRRHPLALVHPRRETPALPSPLSPASRRRRSAAPSGCHRLPGGPPDPGDGSLAQRVADRSGEVWAVTRCSGDTAESTISTSSCHPRVAEASARREAPTTGARLSAQAGATGISAASG